MIKTIGMTTLNSIGLDAAKSEKLANLLNDLLANYSTFYQNARGFHWNVKGEKFFELHLKFEELYNELFVKIDEVAERIDGCPRFLQIIVSNSRRIPGNNPCIPDSCPLPFCQGLWIGILGHLDNFFLGEPFQ